MAGPYFRQLPPPRRYLSLSVGYRAEDRDSSVNINDFDDKQVDARLTVPFRRLGLSGSGPVAELSR